MVSAGTPFSESLAQRHARSVYLMEKAAVLATMAVVFQPVHTHGLQSSEHPQATFMRSQKGIHFLYQGPLHGQ